MRSNRNSARAFNALAAGSGLRLKSLGRTMRCYFLRAGQIEAVELLEYGSDEQLIAQAHALHEVRVKTHSVDRFEIWSGRRLVYRFSKDGGVKDAS